MTILYMIWITAPFDLALTLAGPHSRTALRLVHWHNFTLSWAFGHSQYIQQSQSHGNCLSARAPESLVKKVFCFAQDTLVWRHNVNHVTRNSTSIYGHILIDVKYLLGFGLCRALTINAFISIPGEKSLGLRSLNQGRQLSDRELVEQTSSLKLRSGRDDSFASFNTNRQAKGLSRRNGVQGSLRNGRVNSICYLF